MSLNSLDSKISPHSLHSTNSESSSRPTICTRGCLQGCLASGAGGGAGDFGVINPEGSLKKHNAECCFCRNSRYFRPARRVVKPSASCCRKFVTRPIQPASNWVCISPPYKLRPKSSYNHKPFSCGYLPLEALFQHLPAQACYQPRHYRMIEVRRKRSDLDPALFVGLDSGNQC